MDRAGIPRAVIMQIIGHKTESMFRRYNIVSQRDISEAASRMEQYLEQQKAVAQPHRITTSSKAIN